MMRFRFVWATLAAVAVIILGGVATHWGHGAAHAGHGDRTAAPPAATAGE